ncbi:acyl--CoA ligase [Candidatus Chlorohelix sp.]|uniref:acyl--CoA ligase n=1 Tax=Candidatus Chlorohelix sp. TaxID=3139201 RepID=UPI00304267D1
MTLQEKTLLALLAGADDQPALVAPDKPSLTYAQLKQNITALAATLNGYGLGRGDRIALAMPNCPELIIAFFAAAMCGTAAPLNPKYKQDEFAFYYEDTQAKALITLPGTLEAAHAARLPGMAALSAVADEAGSVSFRLESGGAKARPVELAQSEDVAMILHTSGTTSRPKRVPIRHRNMAASAHNIIGTYNLTEADTALCVMPLFHIHGIIASMLSTLASGGTLVCPNGFNALEFWGIVDKFKPTWYSAVPTMHQMLLARAERNLEVIKANRFRFIRSSSAPLPPIIMERIEALFNAPVLESYGMTEATHQMASNPLPPAQHKGGSVGYGFGVEIGIMDEAGNLLPNGTIGEIVVKGANVVDGYENNPDANAAAFTNGWFRTGDQGLIEADGYLSLTGRIKELINRGGEKISPLEIDDVLLRHPAVAEALAFAVPHKTLGEEVHAAVVLKGEASESELRAYCQTLLAEFKVPRKIHFVSEIPRGATGKLQRINMAKLLHITGD